MSTRFHSSQFTTPMLELTHINRNHSHKPTKSFGHSTTHTHTNKKRKRKIPEWFQRLSHGNNYCKCKYLQVLAGTAPGKENHSTHSSTISAEYTWGHLKKVSVQHSPCGVAQPKQARTSTETPRMLIPPLHPQHIHLTFSHTLTSIWSISSSRGGMRRYRLKTTQAII